MKKIETLSVDIETYGIIEGQDQTVFHPVKMVHIDKVPRDQIIKSVAVGVRIHGDEKCKPVEGHAYVWEEPKHRQYFLDWVEALVRDGGTMLGQNIVFDLMCLRYCCPEFKEITDPYRACWYDDLIIVNFLEYEERPEKGLKPLAMLYGVDAYTDDITGTKGHAKDAYDHDMLKYNARDAIRTLQLYEMLLEAISIRTPTSPKLGELCRSHRDRLIRVGLEMSEAGIYMDKKRLAMRKLTAENIVSALCAEAKREHGLVLKGKGAGKASKDMIRRAVSPELLDHPRLALTEKTKDISSSKDNLILVLSEQGQEHDGYEECKLAYRMTKVNHDITSFYKPLLTNKKKGLVTVEDGRCAVFPDWKLVPRPEGKGGDSESRGTKQGRITAVGPGVQTFPKQVKQCRCSRFYRGELMTWDYKQIELRVPAMLSCDPVMLEELAQGVDQHTKTAKTKILKPVGLEIDEGHPDFRKVWRQAGKRLNFLMVYRGGAHAYRRALLHDAAKAEDYELIRVFDEVMTYDVCEAAIAGYDDEYKVFRAWQDELIQKAIKDGHLELKTGWARTFTGGEVLVRELMINEICNFPIQTYAAQMLQDGQMDVINWMKKEKMVSVMCAQTYDSVTIDAHPREVEALKEVVPGLLTNTKMRSIIDNSNGQVPIEVELE